MEKNEVRSLTGLFLRVTVETDLTCCLDEQTEQTIDQVFRNKTIYFDISRHALTPTFSASKLKQMLGIVVECSDHMAESLKKKAKESDGIFDTKK